MTESDIIAKVNLALGKASPGILAVARCEQRTEHGVLTLFYRFSIVPSVINFAKIMEAFIQATALEWHHHYGDKDYPCFIAKGTIDGKRIAVILVLNDMDESDKE